MKSHKGKQIYNEGYMIKWKILWDLRKFFKYDQTQWLRNNENCFSEKKNNFSNKENINNNRVKKIIFL